MRKFSFFRKTNDPWPRVGSGTSPRHAAHREQRANVRRVNHIASMTVVLEELAANAGLTITSLLLSQAAEEARVTSAQLQETGSPLRLL